jgi:hypothetical protein
VFGSGSDVSFVDGDAIDRRGGFLGPGATPEADGSSEIEVASLDGKVTVSAPGGRVHSHGALTATRASKVGHPGKTATARLKLPAGRLAASA